MYDRIHLFSLFCFNRHRIGNLSPEDAEESRNFEFGDM